MRKQVTPTEDTPQERDDKALVLAQLDRRFRWEIRAYIIIMAGLVLNEMGAFNDLGIN